MGSIVNLTDKAFPFSAVEVAFPLHFLPTNDYFQHRPDRSVPSIESFAECVGVTPQTVRKWRREGYVNGWTADKIAVANRLHPSTLWPAEWRAFLAAEEQKAEPDQDKIREQTRLRTQRYRERLNETL